MQVERSIQKNLLAYGFGTGILFILYFLLMLFFRLTETIEFSALNAVILLITCNIAVKSSFAEGDRRLTFLEVFGLCIVISLIAYAVLSIFMYIYLSMINPEFMNYLSVRLPLGNTMNAAGLALFLMIQGGAWGFLIAFILEQYYKRKTPENKG